MLPTPAFPTLPPPESPSASAPPSAPPFPDHFSAPDLSTLDPEYAQQPPTCYLPDGTPLALTYDRREIFLSAFPEDYRYPETPAACSFLLFLASHPRTVWNAPVPDPEDPAGLLAPLHSRPDAFRDYIDGWKARALTAFNSPAGVLRCQTLARRLWTGQHANQPILPGSDSSEKKISRPRRLPRLATLRTPRWMRSPPCPHPLSRCPPLGPPHHAPLPPPPARTAPHHPRRLPSQTPCPRIPPRFCPPAPVRIATVISTPPKSPPAFAHHAKIRKLENWKMKKSLFPNFPIFPFPIS